MRRDRLRGRIGIAAFHAKEDIARTRHAGRLRDRFRPAYGDVATALEAQPVAPHRIDKSLPPDQRHRRAGDGKLRAEITADGARPHHRDLRPFTVFHRAALHSPSTASWNFAALRPAATMRSCTRGTSWA